MFHSKSSAYSFNPFAIFGPLIIFGQGVTKTLILSKVSLCIFHDANRCKNNQNNQKQVEPLIANPAKWSNTLKQFAGKLLTNCLSVFYHFVGLALKGLIGAM